MRKITLLFLFIIISHCCFGQTVGLLYQDANATEAYTLFTPQKNYETYLVNNCGEKVNQWSFTELPGATCYLLANGNLLRAGKDHIEIRDWDNNLVWSYATTANGIEQHHDICPLPNGNVLCLVIDPYSLAQITAEGRNPAITGANLRLEKIVELHPTGLNTASVVWEWKFKNHIIQDFDATKPNYGIVADHPELLDLNINNGNNVDYIHDNSIDYNAALDQILISARHMSEIYIIDHSTTTAEAASHSGGSSNKGGDFLWRWGNPANYRQGTTADKKLFFQHDAKWVENGYLDYGKITVFNNAAGSNYSAVVMLEPEIVGGVYTKSGNKFNPVTYDWSWNGSILGVTVDQGIMSGTQALPNGNMIISETSLGRISEITKSGTLLWSYKNPTGAVVGGSPTIYAQFSDPSGNNGFFRSEKYPADYIGFTGHNLDSATGIIEDQNSVSDACIAALGNNHPETRDLFALNPVRQNIIEFNQTIAADWIGIYDLNGRLVHSQKNFNGNQIQVDLTQAVYLMQIRKGNAAKKLKIVIVQ